MQSFRHFLEHRDAPILFIDLDGTLVHTSFRPNWSEMLVSPRFREKRDHFAALRDVRLRFLDMSLGEQLTVMKKLGGVPILHGVEAVSFLRPGAREFLIECMGIARTCILTQGTQSLQRQVVDGLDIPVKDLYGNRGTHEQVDYGTRVPQSPAAILVDDMPQSSPLVQRKLKTIGLDTDTNRFIKVTGWKGFDAEDDYPAVLKQIRTLVKS